ncbi:replication-associated recombination protein A, partial [bacterium]|nr:replication-associated recombination protein A [bacterium]
RIASEDVGLADPNALPMVVAARQAYQMLGSPEGDLALAEAVIYLATAPKSNSVEAALDCARERASETGDHPVPVHLRNAPTRMMKDAGYGREYIYDHNEPGGYAGQDFLPEKLIGETYYQPKSWGYEREIIKRMEWWSKRKRDIQEKG